MQLTALLSGELVNVDGCLRIDDGSGTSFLVIWPADFALDTDDGEIRIRDGFGEVVARVGDTLGLGGGAFGENADPIPNSENLPPDCAPPYWESNGRITVQP